MTQPLRILSVEDNPSDAALIKDLLETEDIVCEVTRVETESALLASFEQGAIDLILADYTLPSFDGLSALKLAMKVCPDVPFIFVSGTLGEEVAIEALKIGATDYVLKTRISRLVPSVIRALREVKERTERKQAIENLRRSEAYLAEAQQLSHTGSFGWEVSTGEIYWSRETFRIFGYEPTPKVTIEMVVQRTHPEDREAVRQLIDRVSKERKEWDFEHRLLMPDGSVKYLRVVGHPSRDEAGNFEFVGAVTDITERRRNEEELRRLTDVIPETIIVLNPDGRAIYANRMVLKYTGLSLEEVQADDFRARVFHPDDIQRLREERPKALSGNSPFENEQRALGKDGRYRWFLIRYNPLMDKSGKVIRWYAAGTDIDDRKQVEDLLRREQEELHAKHELLELAQRAAHAMAFDWYIQEDVNTWSPGQEALYGLSPGTFDGKYETWKKLIHPDDWPLIVKAVKHSHETGNISAEFRVVWPDGSVHWLVARGQMFMDAGGRPYRMVGFTADITQRKLAEDTLRRNEASLLEAQRLSHTGSWTHDVLTGRVTVSPEILRIFDVKADDVTSTTDLFRDRIHPEDWPRVAASHNRSLAAKIDFESDYRIVLPDGSIKYIHNVGHPKLSDSGQLLEYVGTTMDLTEQYNARAALERAFEEIKTLKDRLHRENVALREDIARSSMFEEIVGSSPVLNKVLAQVEKVASTDSTVLILGETGTGKELIARAIHYRSKRANRAFATVNCASIPASLIASELFGHEKGAFTGATQRRLGRFESADGGTIFLDEIGELPPQTQVALLRVLQERQLERLGGHQTISVDVRVLAATNRDLAAAVAENAFRQDLFYRLNVFPIQLPALRDRTGDIPLLVEYLVERYAHKAGKKIRNISKETLDLFQSYSWPGNIRELQNVVERAVILCEGETFSVDASWLPAVPAGSVSTTAPLASDLARREKTMIENALREAQGRISGPVGAAAKLGLPRQTLESKIKRLGIKRHRFKTS